MRRPSRFASSLSVTAVASAIALTTLPAFAQQAPASPDSEAAATASDTDATGGEIVVTASKRVATTV